MIRPISAFYVLLSLSFGIYGCASESSVELITAMDMGPPIMDALPDAPPAMDMAPSIPDVGPPPSLEGAARFAPEGLPSTSIQPSLALDDAGQLALAGCGGDGDDLGIWFALFDVEGTPIQAPYTLDTTTMGVQNEPSVCPLAEGGYVVVWSMDAQEVNADGQNLYIRARRVAADGTPADETDVEIHSGSPGNHWLAEVACDPRGGYLVVGACSEENSTFGVFAQRFHADGRAVGEAITLNSDPMGTQAFPSAAFAANGDAVLVWEDSPFDGQPDAVTRIVARRLPADADAPPDPEIIITRPIYDATKPQVAVDPASGGFLVGAILDNRRLGVYTVDAEDGVTAVTVPMDGTRHSPTARAAGHERYLVLHSNGVNAGAAPSLFLVDAGELTDGPVDLTTANIPPYPVALAHRDGRTVAAWTERTEDGALAVRLVRNY